MILCSKCQYGWNPDTATNCVQCKTPLTASATPKRSDTLNEDLPHGDASRNSSPGTPPPVPLWSNPAQSPPAPIVPGPGVPSSDSEQRRRTVFGGLSPAGETPTPIAASTRRPQTVAVDPARKIVGVLITYSWQESGQVFPVLEGRNLIGKDPDQCDICIPQDNTLSAVNSFITYRRHFLIGDKVSMSGTDVDGEPIESEFVPLRNYAKIRTGSTYWTFVCIQPPSASGDEPASGS